MKEVKRRRKNAQEKAKDQELSDSCQKKLNEAVKAFFEALRDTEGCYREIGVGYYDNLKDAHEMMSMPVRRLKETHVTRDFSKLKKEEVNSTSSLYWYDNE